LGDEPFSIGLTQTAICSSTLGASLHPPIVRSVGVVIASSKDKVVLAGDYSAPGDELNRLTRIPTSMVRAVRTLEKKPYLGE